MKPSLFLAGSYVVCVTKATDIRNVSHRPEPYAITGFHVVRSSNRKCPAGSTCTYFERLRNFIHDSFEYQGPRFQVGEIKGLVVTTRQTRVGLDFLSYSFLETCPVHDECFRDLEMGRACLSQLRERGLELAAVSA